MDAGRIVLCSEHRAPVSSAPNQVIRADDLAWAMVDVVLRQTQERQGLVFENRDIRAMVESPHPPAG